MMQNSAGRFVWFKRGVLLCSLLLLGLMVGLCFGSVPLLKAILAPQLEARGGQLKLDSLRLDSSGVVLRVEQYEEAGLRISGLQVNCRWSQLWSWQEGFSGSVRMDEVHWQLDEVGSSDTAVPSLRPQEQAAALAQLVPSLPLQAVDLTVDSFSLEVADIDVRGTLRGNLLRDASGEAHFTMTAQTDTVFSEVRTKVSAEGAALAVDFVLSAKHWEDFQKNYLQELKDAWAQAGVEVYINSLGEKRGFLDVSGYARWSEAEPDRLRYTLLADLGASEVYLPQGEVLLQSSAVGLAHDSARHSKMYARGATDSIRMGTWMELGGDWGLQLVDAGFSGEIHIGETLAFSWEHENWRQLLAGSGSGRFYLASEAMSAELLRLFDGAQLPEGLEMDGALRIEGVGSLDAWQPTTAEITAAATVKRASLTSKKIVTKKVELQADLQRVATGWQSAALELKAESLELAGFVLQKLNIAATAEEAGSFVVQPITAQLMGGSLRLEKMRLDPQVLEKASFRVHLEGIDLSQLAAVVPQFEGEITGQLSGYLIVALRAGQPILTDGHLAIDSESDARLSYDVYGLLTRGMPESSSAYKQYHMAERAFEDLALKHFSIDVFPEGMTQRPFRLELFGESQQGKLVVPVDFSLNVNVDDTTGLLELLRMIQSGELELN